MKSKFRIGESVRIKPRKEGQANQSPHYTEEMTLLQGAVLKVIGFTERGYVMVQNYAWRAEWLEKAKLPKLTIKELLNGKRSVHH